MGWSPLVAQVDLQSPWNLFWDAVSGVLGDGVLVLVQIIGAILIVRAILKWLWEKSSSPAGSGGGLLGRQGNSLLWSLGLGMFLVSPALIPTALGILEAIINAGVA